ncbi:collagen binding domain-containing protein [Virgibacillus oceani]
MNKRLSILFIFMLVFQTVSSSLFLPSQAVAEGSEQSIFTGVSYTDEDGNAINIDEMDDESAVNVHVDWSIAHVEIEAEHTESLSLPEGLLVEEEQQGVLSDAEGETEVGAYQAAIDGAVTVSFNEAITENPEAEGTFVVDAVAVEQQLDQSEEAVEEEDSVGNQEEEVAEETTEESIEEGLTEERTEKANEEEVVNHESEANEVSEEEGTTTSAFSEVQPLTDLGNIFTFDSLTINEEDVQDGDVISIDEDTIANLRFNWSTEGLNARDGDTAEVRLSDAFEIVTTPLDNIIVEGTVVGTYHVENGVLKFVFNENVENDNVRNGYVDLGLEFDLEKFRENIEQEIPFSDNDETNITVIARPNIDHSGIEKEGHPDTQHDAREITWTIDVLNTNDEEITDATLADNIPSGLGEARDFVIHKLSIGYDGDVREGADVTSAINPSEFSIELGEIAPFNGYRVQYTTAIENYAAESFTNDATFAYGEESLPADATVGGLTRSNPIEKDGWQVGDSDVIKWQIDVNKNGSLISEAIVEDNLPYGLTVDPDTIEVVRITQDGDNWVEGDPHEGTFTEFPINLGSLGQEDAYRIKFETAVDWEEVNSGEYLENNGFENDATLYDGVDELNDDQATVTIERDPILEKVEVGNVDYENRTVTWEVTVNEAKHPLTDVTVTDYLPEGLVLEEVIVTDEDGATFADANWNTEDVTDGEHAGKTELTISLVNVGTETITINYTTRIDDFNLNEFTNTVGMTGEGVGEGGEEREVTIVPNANTYTKSFAGIDYNEKTIDWRLNVNPVREDIQSGFTITDTFPNDGLILLPDSVNIKLGKDDLEEGPDYTVDEIEEGYQNGFTITFHQEIADGELVVNFTTSYDPQEEIEGNFLIPHSNEDEEVLYRNKAEFDGTTENGNTVDEEDDAYYEVREDSWNSGKKEGQLVHFDEDGNRGNGWVSGSERKIAWQLYTNYQGQNLGENVTITDILDYTGEIDDDSIKVSVYDVKSDGTTEITGTVLEPENYELVVTGNEFTITFDNEVTERYVVEFTTSVPDISESKYTNNATVDVDGEKYDYTATVNYSKHDYFLEKGAIDLTGDQVFTGDEVEWQATVNKSLSIIQNAEITDTISSGHIYIEDSLEVYRLQDQGNVLKRELIIILRLNQQRMKMMNLLEKQTWSSV